jgi:folate-binding protein YgfZ
VLALEDRLWIDLDRRIVGTALGHLNRYLITEDAQPIDVSERFGRLAIIGPEAGAVVSGLGLGNLAPMAQLQHVQGEVDGAPVRLVRHDFCGLPAAELIVPSESVGAVQASIGRIGGGAVAEIGASTLEVLRVEAGRPASVEDIDEGVLPPETLQVERGISYHKGCYLGQEVIERMRSRGSLARQLVGIRLGGDAVPARGTVVQTDGKDVGRVTSGVWSEALGAVLVLGYVKTAYAAAGTAVAVVVGEDAVAGEVVPLPVGRG